MIEGVEATKIRAAADGGTARNAAGGNFAAVLSDATDATADRFERLQRQLRVPRGERWEAVPGHSDYADIVSGPRNGWFINLSDGPRRGEVFHRIRKDGREYHVYGEGRNREVIEVKRRDAAERPERPERTDPSRVRPREGEAFEAVPGHRDYQRIEGGQRDDLYINLSGNERTGRAFEIVERDGKRYHVYGEGENRLEVRVGWRRERNEAPAPAPTGGGDPE